MEKKNFVFELSGDQIEKLLEYEVSNLLLNMSGGLLPKDLTPDEVKLLINKFGNNWFYELGYDDTYEHPKCECYGIIAENINSVNSDPNSLIIKNENIRGKRASINPWLFDYECVDKNMIEDLNKKEN